MNSTRSVLQSHPTIATHATSISLGRYVGRGLRLFYPNVTLKVRQKSKSDGKNPKKPWFVLEQEGRNALRQKLGNRTAIRVPEIFDAGEYGEVSYLLEERLSFRVLTPQNPEDRQLLLDLYLPNLLAWYDSPEERPFSSLFEGDLAGLLETALESPAMAELDSVQSQCVHTLVDELARLDMVVPFADGHGDMSLKNTGVTPERELVLMDWEAYQTRPVALEFNDLIRPFGIGSEVHQAIRKAYSRQFQIAPELFDRQLCLFNLTRWRHQLLLAGNRKDPQKRRPFLQAALVKLESAKRFAQTAQDCSCQPAATAR
ncbi:hypothetical protein NEA10_20125 [Phormidium yuhuli AB48]|uniref:Aminoglycoside phosphotransferase domain-containing protein n=1 Tax=Phormidium yuhuli AB48 TaxID=2940671 RepID=A0ABY5AQI4_9CYAN|nr:hypothetical protein [Phormidium yuhuli]USR91102.1 hypothetical protein NEA10_20125 [Phormidium yuhuli AB48]